MNPVRRLSVNTILDATKIKLIFINLLKFIQKQIICILDFTVEKYTRSSFPFYFSFITNKIKHNWNNCFNFYDARTFEQLCSYAMRILKRIVEKLSRDQEKLESKYWTPNILFPLTDFVNNLLLYIYVIFYTKCVMPELHDSKWPNYILICQPSRKSKLT